MARVSGVKVISIDYTLAPTDNWEKIQGDVLKVNDALLADGYTNDDIAIYGDSAGGGLTLSTVLNLRDNGLGMPAVVGLWASWARPYQ
ncbi:MAG: alpha/beta hydrolase [Rhizobiales bacterium]|nr:alpha/beta hydrolase [Hyphomicrobiales bacterium]